MTLGAWLLTAIGPLIILVASWLMPSLAPPTLPFGVRVPPDRVDSPVIAEQRRQYRWFVGVVGVALIGAGLLLMAFLGGGQPVLGALIPLLVLAVCLPGYLRARSAILTAKTHEHWYAGLREGVAVDTSLRTDPVPFPWAWAAPAIGILLATVVLAIIRYPGLPDRLIMHVNASGHPDRTVAKSVLSVATPILVQLGITVALMLAVALSLRSRGDLDPAEPRTSAQRHRGFTVRVSRAILVLAAFVNLSVLAMCWQIWSDATTLSVWPVAVPILVGLVVLFGVILTTGQLGSRIAADAHEAPTGLVHRDDDRYWRGGLVYVNRDDPSVFVPKRYGVGWTVNFGNPRGLLVIVVILAVALLGPLVGALANR